jgi:hypothetical protein
MFNEVHRHHSSFHHPKYLSPPLPPTLFICVPENYSFYGCFLAAFYIKCINDGSVIEDKLILKILK